MYDAREIANAMLDFAAAEGIAISHLKLQKLLYLAHGFLLVTEERPLVKGGFEAWEFGPVSRVAYGAFKKFDSMPITEPAKKFNPLTGTHEDITICIDQVAAFAIEHVIRKFGNWSVFELVEFTHQPGTPWSITQDEARVAANVGMIIDDTTIRSHFEGTDELEVQQI